MDNNKSYNRAEEKDISMIYNSRTSLNPHLMELEYFFLTEENAKRDNTQTLPPIIKWPGGKEKELKYILPNVPAFNRFFEPFVGGGSVFMAIHAKEYYINDLSSELISLYNSIATYDKKFFRYAEMMDKSWENAVAFFNANHILIDIYLKYREEKITKEELKTFVQNFCAERKRSILDIIGEEFTSLSCILLKEMEINLFRKMTRMRELEIKKHILSYSDLLENIKTAVKSAVYMNYRYMYNRKDIENYNKSLQAALFFFIRNYAYCSMFRYSSKGEFNVPYGGIAYNSKLMAKKLNYYRSKPLLQHFANTQIFNLDFETFLRETRPTRNDFVFLDPPYDSEFSTYAQNTFTCDDQKRLADYMINECKAKWMIIIKNTDFIFNLYNKEGINIKAFDKEYLVSFMNRNDKKVTHLIITNY